MNLYPDGSAFGLHSALAAHYQVAPAEVFVGNGSNELIELLVRTFVLDGEEVLASAQSFIAYKLAANAHGRTFVEAPMKARFHYDLDALKKLLGRKTKVVFLANPDNPTGSWFSEKDLLPFLDAAPKDTLVVLDEAYAEYVDAPGYQDSLALRKKYPNLVVLRTFSKIYGLAGLRVGYGLARPDLVEYLDRVRAPFNVNHVAQAAAAAALGDTEHVARSRALVLEQRPVLSARLAELGATVVPSQGNFVLADFPGRPSKALFEDLLREGVVMRPDARVRVPDRTADHGRAAAREPEVSGGAREGAGTVTGGRPFIVAVDGPAGAGKSSASRMLAARLGFAMVDTGAIYRAVALAARRAGIGYQDDSALEALLAGLRIRFAPPARPGQGQRVLLGDEDVSAEIRTPPLAMGASAVSARPVVRAGLLELQRRLALAPENRGAVLEGRDIGTVVFPDADAKFFLTASAEERARRRHAELRARGEQVALEDVLAEQVQRDRDDSERAVAPLRPAADAVQVDTTGVPLEAVVERLAGEVVARLAAAGAGEQV